MACMQTMKGAGIALVRATVSRLAMVLALLLLAAPLAAQTPQVGKVYRVGFLTGYWVPELFNSFRQGLLDLGWREDQNLVLEARSADGKIERIPALAAELVRLKVDVIVVSATAVNEAKHAIDGTPTVFLTTDDPVSAGYVTSLARPGGRMTGVTSLNLELDAKRLEILIAAVPGVSRVGILSNPHDLANRERVAAVERGARTIGVQTQVFEVPNPDQVQEAFDAAARARMGALMMLGSAPFYLQQSRMALLAAKTRLPVISAWRDFPDAGGLMSYGTSVPAMYRRASSFVDRILKGANPADLPVERAATFELVINLKTAKAFGLTIPPSLLLRANQVIE